MSAALDAPAPAPVRRPLRCAETPTSGSGGVARRGRSERGPRSTSVYTCTYTQPKISRGERHRAADAVAGGRCADGVRPGPRRGRPASPPSRTARRLLAAGVWTTTSLGPPNCHTEQWSLPPAHVHGQNRPLSRVSLSVERAFLNSQRARVARHNPPRVIGKPGSLPSLCLLGGRVCVSWKRLRADSA